MGHAIWILAPGSWDAVISRDISRTDMLRKGIRDHLCLVFVLLSALTLLTNSLLLSQGKIQI